MKSYPRVYRAIVRCCVHSQVVHEAPLGGARPQRKMPTGTGDLARSKDVAMYGQRTQRAALLAATHSPHSPEWCVNESLLEAH